MQQPSFAFELMLDFAFGSLLWLSAYLLSPRGYKISLWRGIGASMLTTVVSFTLPRILQPWIGDWHLLVAFLVFVIIVKSMLQLNLWRSVIVVMIYVLVVAGIATLLSK